MKKKLFTSLSFILTTFVIIFNNCTAQKKNIESFNDTVVLSSKETKRIKGTDIILELESCGRKWDTHGEEWPFCNLYIHGKDTSIQLSGLNGPVYLKNIVIEIVSINPWGTEQNGIPAGGCKVTIRTAPAVLLLNQYQKQAIQLLNTDSISIPSNCCTDQAFGLYAHASEAIGFKLSSLAGKRLAMQKWKLANVEKRTGENYIAIMLIGEDGKAITGWIAVSPKSDMTPGISPLNAPQLQ